MKIKSIITLSFLIFSINFYGQKLNIGLHGGANNTSLYNSQLGKDYKPEIGYLFGVSIKLKIDNMFSILTNINYEKKSVSKNYIGRLYPQNEIIINPNDYPLIDIKSEIKFETITIPFMLQCKFDDEEAFFINAGPFITIPLNVKNYNNGIKNNLDFNYILGSQNIGLTFGLGYEFDINEKNFGFIELRNDFGLTEINSMSTYDINGTKMNSLSLTIGCNFDFFGKKPSN